MIGKVSTWLLLDNTVCKQTWRAIESSAKREFLVEGLSEIGDFPASHDSSLGAGNMRGIADATWDYVVKINQ